ncbi:MAG: carboxypeptidase regulatory-like domain-containing protein [Planctomycetes bacterium]|nr:carboxypeptidase regulatory-like domain-containing protein [Planctomycetota bacterium]
MTEARARLQESIAIRIRSGESEAMRTVQLACGEENTVEFLLKAERTAVFGRVLNPARAPVPKATIVAVDKYTRVHIGLSVFPFTSKVAFTDPDGRYEISLPDDSLPVHVVAHHPDHSLYVSELQPVSPGKEVRCYAIFPQGARARIAIPERKPFEIPLTPEPGRVVRIVKMLPTK